MTEVALKVTEGGLWELGLETGDPGLRSPLLSPAWAQTVQREALHRMRSDPVVFLCLAGRLSDGSCTFFYPI